LLIKTFPLADDFLIEFVSIFYSLMNAEGTINKNIYWMLFIF
jgi:hypothetical protein